MLIDGAESLISEGPCAAFLGHGRSAGTASPSSRLFILEREHGLPLPRQVLKTMPAEVPLSWTASGASRFLRSAGSTASYGQGPPIWLQTGMNSS